MTQQRKRLSGPEKVAIVKRYLIDRVAISDLCDEYQLQPSQIYRWQAAMFEHGADVFDLKKGRRAKAAESAKDARIAQLEAVVAKGRQDRPEERGDLRADGGEHPGKKSQWGALKGRWVPHDTRDEVVDYVRHWTADRIARQVTAGWLGSRTSKFHHWSGATARSTSTTAGPARLWLEDWEKQAILGFHRQLSAGRLSPPGLHDARQRRRGGQPVERLPRAQGGRPARPQQVPSKKGPASSSRKSPTNTGTSTSATSISTAHFTICTRSRWLQPVHRPLGDSRVDDGARNRDCLQGAGEVPGVKPRIISDNGPQFVAKDFKHSFASAG